jgi:hypothetical protein
MYIFWMQWYLLHTSMLLLYKEPPLHRIGHTFQSDLWYLQWTTSVAILNMPINLRCNKLQLD